MTKPIDATSRGLDPHYKIRLSFPGALLHIASSTEPRWNHHTRELIWTPINDARYGDTLGHVDWSTVQAITWRWAE